MSPKPAATSRWGRTFPKTARKSIPNSNPTTPAITPPPSSTIAASQKNQPIRTSIAKTTPPKPPRTTTLPQPQCSQKTLDSDLGNIDGGSTKPDKPGTEQSGPEKTILVETASVLGTGNGNRNTAPTHLENEGSGRAVTGTEEGAGPGNGKKKKKTRKVVRKVVRVVKKVIKKRVPKKPGSENQGLMVKAEEGDEVTDISSFDSNEIGKSNSADDLIDKPCTVNELIVIPNIVENLNVANEIIEIVNDTNFLDRESELVNSGETSKLEFGEIPCVLDSMEVERVDHIAENVMETDIFVGGFHGDKTNEDDIRKVFEEAGVVLEVRLIMFSNSAKNRGFAFVRFATAADAKNALAKCSNVEICGKQCSVAPVGKICLASLDRTWETDYVVTLLENAGIEKIIKLTRKKKSSSAFLEFETSEDAHIAFNKLRKKDAFGKNPTVVVEWAVPEHMPMSVPLPEPMPMSVSVPVPEPMPMSVPVPEPMPMSVPVPERNEEENLSVKSVYAEYLPYSWDEENVREYFKRFGEIDNVVLATDLSSWGRKDSAFIHYTNRDAALRCIEVVGRKRSGDHSPKGMIAVSLAKLNPTSKPMECTPDRTSKQLPIAKPETKQNTVWSRLGTRDTEQSLPISEISAKLHDRLGPVPLKRSASSSDRVSPAKKPKGPPRSTPPASPTGPSITTGVLNITDGEIAAQYIQSLCPSPDHLTLEKFGDTELVNSFCLDHSKAMAKLAVLVSRSKQGYTNTELTNELNSLKKDSAKLRSEAEENQTLVRRLMDVAGTFQTRAKSQEEKIKNLEDENGTLRAGMDKLQAECTERIDKARAEGVRAGHRGFPESKDGLALIQSVREITKRAFLRSGEFWTFFVKGAMFYYSYALDEAEKWASSRGFNEKFEREGPLGEAPDPPFVEFCKEDNRVNSLEPEAFAAHVLLQLKRDRPQSPLR